MDLSSNFALSAWAVGETTATWMQSASLAWSWPAAAVDSGLLQVTSIDWAIWSLVALQVILATPIAV